MYQTTNVHPISSVKPKRYIKVRTSASQQDKQVKSVIDNYRNNQNFYTQKENKNIFANQKSQFAQIPNFKKYRKEQINNFISQRNYLNLIQNQSIKNELKSNRKMVLGQIEYMQINSTITNQKQKTDRRNISQLWDPSYSNISTRYTKNNLQRNILRPDYIDKTYMYGNLYPKKVQKIKIVNHRTNKPTENVLQIKNKVYFQTATLKGSKQFNQDSIKTGNNIWIVCDGHGELGHEVSSYASNVLYQLFQQRRGKEKISKDMLKDIFSEVQRNLQQSGIDVSLSGSTCVMVVIDEQKLYCACLGDSMAITIYENQQYQIISSEHKPCNPQQAKRIQFYGGMVKKTFGKQHLSTSPLRLWGQGSDQWGPGLAISRSFGDRMAQKYGLIYQPQVKEIPINKQLKCIVLGSDGLFDQVKPTQMANILNFQIKKQKKQGCKLLTQIAKSRWLGYSDDISAVVVWL